MEETLKIKVLQVNKLEKNMHIELTTKSGETKSGYFKKFMVKIDGNNVYRASVAELPKQDDIYLFFTDQEQDQIVQGGNKQFVKSDSVPVAQIDSLFVIPPANLVPMFSRIHKELKDLKNVVRQQQQQINDLITFAQSAKERSSRDHEKSSKEQKTKSAR